MSGGAKGSRTPDLSLRSDLETQLGESLSIPDNPVFSSFFRTLSVKLCYEITANFTPFSTVSLDGN